MPELNVPSYQYLGPFTKLDKRLKRGDPGINPLDRAAKEHDNFYSTHSDTHSRHLTDKQLENKAWERVLAPDSSITEKAAAYLTTNTMKAKRKLGVGCSNPTLKKKKKKKKTKKLCSSKKQSGGALSFGSLVCKAKTAVKDVREKDIQDLPLLRKKVEEALKAIGSRKGLTARPLKRTRIIPIPRSGGMLPLIPIIAGVSKIGAIAGGVSAVVNAIRDIVRLRREGQQQQVGSGLFLAPYRKGYGLFLSPPNPKN